MRHRSKGGTEEAKRSPLCRAEDVDSGEVFSAPLVALPGQWPEVPWPTESWPTGPADGVAIEHLLDQAFDTSAPLAEAHAVVVISGGRLVAERYGGTEPRSEGTIPVGPESTLLSWSMAKSIV
jgi:hypothetical protein